MKTDRLERLLHLVQLLQSGRARSADDLADIAHVSRRTIFRDMDVLTRAGITYTYDHVTRRYEVQDPVLLPPTSLSHAEAMLLLLISREYVKQPFVAERTTADSAALKLEGMLPPILQDECGTLAEYIEMRAGPATDATTHQRTLDTLQSALAGRRRLRIQYESLLEGRQIEETIDIYRIAFVVRGWYLLAYTHSAGEVRTYKMGRIRKIAFLHETYRIDPSFSLDTYFGNAWSMIRDDKHYLVRIHFLPMVARNVAEVRWHKTQRVTLRPDGSIVFEVAVDGIREISWWVLGYGDQAEVLAPPELRTIIAQRARNMLAMYGSNSDPQDSDVQDSDVQDPGGS